MVKRHSWVLVTILAASVIAACTATPTPPPSPAARRPTPLATIVVPTGLPPTVVPATPASTDTLASPTLTPPTLPAASSEIPDGTADQVAGTAVRFSAGSTAVEVTIGADHPAVRNVLAMLPLTLRLEEFNGREKIAYLPRKLAHAGSPGSDPEDGDLIYYVPWGNLGFYYNTAGS